jgi:hypothetical protein
VRAPGSEGDRRDGVGEKVGKRSSCSERVKKPVPAGQSLIYVYIYVYITFPRKCNTRSGVSSESDVVRAALAPSLHESTRLVRVAPPLTVCVATYLNLCYYIRMTETKTCTCCTKTKSTKEFYKDSRSPDKLNARCKDCIKEYKAQLAEKREVVAPGTMLECQKCRQKKEAAKHFYTHPTSKSGYSTTRCKSCMSDYYQNGNRQPQERTPELIEYQRNYQLMKNYGITSEEYDAKLEEQNGQCAICGATEPGCGWEYFAVDHDHETLKVRELLCTSCNWMLGHARDMAEILEAGAAYLRRHRA